MKKIVVLGESIAGVKAIEEIRRFEPESEAVILATDGHYPYDRNLFIPAIAKEIDYKKIFYKSNDFYEKNRIQVIVDRPVARINLKKKKITTEDKQQIDYDLLIVAAAAEYKFPEIKGASKSGVFSLNKISEVDAILDILALVETVVIQTDDFKGLSIASAFLKRGKEVIWIVSTTDILMDFLDPEISRLIVSALEQNKLRIVRNNTIAEILGESDAKAVRLKSGKVLSAEMIVFPDAEPDWKTFAESSLTIKRKIGVNEQFQTGVEGVLAVDAACECPEKPLWGAEQLSVQALEAQGTAVGRTIKEENNNFSWPVAHCSFAFNGLTIDLLGHCRRAAGTKESLIFNADTTTGKTLFIENGRAVGAFLINAAQETDRFRQLIEGKLNLEDISEFSAARVNS